MCKILGANLNIFDRNFQPFFILNGQHKIHILYDICHTEKLVRGQFDKKGIFINGDEEEIKWNYIVQLVKFSQEKGFSFTHKLNQSHLEWRRRPMNVRIAVETLSKSTAESIQFLMQNGYKEFAGAAPTIKFIETFDLVFDIFNTKSTKVNENIFKVAMNKHNKDAIINAFNEIETYIKDLKFKKEAGEIRKVCRSEFKTGFSGTIINMHSLKHIYEEYVESEKPLLSCIPSYYLNQDGVEIFFGKVRSLGRFNDNPNVIHFQAAYRKLLGCDTVFLSRKGNCEALNINENPFSDILHVSSRRDKHHEQTDQNDEFIVTEEVELLYKKLSDVDACGESSLTDTLRSTTLAHIANLIEERIKRTENCLECVNVFSSCEKMENTFQSSRIRQKPCKSTYIICKEADRFMQLQFLKGNFNFNTIYFSIINNISIERMYIEADFSRHSDHKLYLIRAVIDLYIHIKATFMARSNTKEMQSKLLRYKFRKLVHFHGQ